MKFQRLQACIGKTKSLAKSLGRTADDTRGKNAPGHSGAEFLNIIDRGDRSRAVTAFSALRFSLFLLLALLPLNSFAQAHLLKQRPFRATDTALSGGDHICDLRRDGDGNGKPDRLGDYVRVSGTVIAEPSTFERGGWLFWIREGACGMLVYGEQENLSLGDSITACGCLRMTNGNYFFPETGMATLGDLAIENRGISVRGRSANVDALPVACRDFVRAPETYGGNLISISGLRLLGPVHETGNGTFVCAASGGDSVLIYLDTDTGVSIGPEPSGCFTINGVAVRMDLPGAVAAPFGRSPAWCIAPRCQADIVPAGCSAGMSATSWGSIKALRIE